MPFWKSLILGLYYGSTCPYRWWRNARVAAAGKSPIVALYYHRVADDQANEWTVTNVMFAKQIAWLHDHFDMISLGAAQQRLRSGLNHRPAVCITFDDGYADNCQRALPLLIERKIPCTYFVSNQQIFERLPFPHDCHAGRSFESNTVAQLRELAESGIEIGAHTRTHCDLGAISDPDRMYDEVVTAGEELQAALGHPVRHFAFPYGQHGNLNRRVFHLAYEAGYEGVCSAYGGFNFPGDDAFHLQRAPADYSLLRLKNWATVDPRKVRTPRFTYETPAEQRRRSGAMQR